MNPPAHCSAVQSQKAVAGYISSKQLLPFHFQQTQDIESMIALCRATVFDCAMARFYQSEQSMH